MLLRSASATLSVSVLPAFDAFCDDLNRGVGGNTNGPLGSCFWRLEGINQFLVAWIPVEGLRQRHVHAFGGRAGDGGDFRVADAFRTHEAHVQTFSLD